MEPCPACEGSCYFVCPWCNGQGSRFPLDGVLLTCHACKGTGQERCRECNGVGGLLATPAAVATPPTDPQE